MKRTTRKLIDRELFDSHRFDSKSYRADRAHISVEVGQTGGINPYVRIANVAVWRGECTITINLPIMGGRVVVPDVETGGTSASVHVTMHLYTEYGKPDPPERDRY